MKIEKFEGIILSETNYSESSKILNVLTDKYGNKAYGKIEPKLRKNDGFMAFLVAFFCRDLLDEAVIYI